MLAAVGVVLLDDAALFCHTVYTHCPQKAHHVMSNLIKAIQLVATSTVLFLVQDSVRFRSVSLVTQSPETKIPKEHSGLGFVRSSDELPAIRQPCSGTSTNEKVEPIIVFETLTEFKQGFY